jgi:hypothetical protein
MLTHLQHRPGIIAPQPLSHSPIMRKQDSTVSIQEPPLNLRHRITKGRGNSAHFIDNDTPPHVSTAPLTVIGIILSNGGPRADRYQCHVRGCSGMIFNRLADLKRHHSNRHARNRLEFWCPVQGCQRSKGGDGIAFPRKDKRDEHVHRVHDVGV